MVDICNGVRQRKGITLVKPSENLAKAYLGKSRNALKSMGINAKEGIVEWAMSASYYARYFVIYGLLAKIGVKCEIHDCTIALFEFLFGNTVSTHLIQELRDSKRDRVEAQYYPVAMKVDLDKVMSETRTFVLEIERILDGLNSQEILRLQRELRKLRTAARKP